MLVLVVGAVFVFVLGSDGIDHPDEWDERVLPFVKFVEAERGLDFRHPVYVDFLTAEEYSAFMRVDEDEMDEEDLEALDELVTVFRALGLDAGDFDPLAAVNQMSDEATLAVYTYDDQRIVIRGTEVDQTMEATLVHELVHVLQDQHFDLGRLERFETSSEATAFRAVVEGDAMLVEQRYRDGLAASERELDPDDLADVDLDDVPDALVALFATPYALGGPLVEAVQATRGWSGVDRLLAHPPTTDVELLDPARIERGFTPTEVEPPTLEPGDEIVDEGDFGAITLYLMLAARVDVFDALAAAERWAGDHYALVRDVADRHCIVVAFAADDSEGLALLSATLEEWAATASPRAAAAITVDEVVTLRTCDPGAGQVAAPEISSTNALALPAMLSYLRAAMLGQGLSEDSVRCMTTTVLTDMPLELLTDPDPPVDVVEEWDELMVQVFLSCREV